MAFYQQEPFVNPPIPFTGAITGALQEGKSIIIRGQILPGAKRFHVNLQCGSRPGADVALHFNPRYDSGPGYIVTNTYQNSSWGTEERLFQAVFPSGSPFTLVILVTSDSYKISVNGNHIMDYKHRIPFNMVDAIVVDGMVKINSIDFQNPQQYNPQPGFSVPSYAAQSSFCMPYKTIINGGLRPGKNISIHGVINHQAQGFMVSLRHRDGVAFVYNPRFNENVVVRNSLALEKWGHEERAGGMPFQRGQNIQMVIDCNPYHYNVFLNGQQVHTYNHRFTRLEDIDVLEVVGDLNLTSVDIIPNF